MPLARPLSVPATADPSAKAAVSVLTATERVPIAVTPADTKRPKKAVAELRSVTRAALAVAALPTVKRWPAATAGFAA